MTIIAKDLIQRLQHVDPYAKVYVGRTPLLDGPAPVAIRDTVDLDPEHESNKQAIIAEAEMAIAKKANPALEKLIEYRSSLDDDSAAADEIDSIIEILGDL
jgi:hypothetical protein